MSHFHEDKVLSELKSLGVKVPKSVGTRTKRFISKVSKQEKYHVCSACKVFGVPLSEQEKILLSDFLLPKFIVEATSYLKNFVREIGLFRKAGSISRQRKLRVKLENGGSIEECEPNDVASLLKQWLRELPEPLIPVYLHDLFLRAQNVDNNENKISAVLLCCHLLPTDHLLTLKHLMDFFSYIALNSDTNKMENHNLAVIMAPNIFVIRTDSVDKSSGNLVQLHATVVELLISNADKIDFPTSLYLEDSEASKYNNRLDISIEVLNSNPRKCKKKRSGPVQDLFSGIRKLVRQNSTSPNFTRKDQDKPTFTSRSVSKRKADSSSEQWSSTPEKRKPSKLSENIFTTLNTPSLFQEKFCLTFEEPVKAEIDSSKEFLPLDSDGILPKLPFVKNSISECYLTPKSEEFKDLSFETYSSSRVLSDQKNKSPLSRLRNSNKSKKVLIKCKSDGLKNEMEFFSPKNVEENNSNHALQFACNENLKVSPLLSKEETPKRHSLSPVNIKDIDNINVTGDWNSGSPILKDCYVALSKAEISKLNVDVFQKEIISGSVNKICNNSNAVLDQHSNLILNSYNNNSLYIPQVLSADDVEVCKTNLYFKDANKVMDKLDVPSLSDSKRRPFLNTEMASNDCSTESLNNAKLASKDISAINTKFEKAVNENLSSKRFDKKSINACVSDCSSTMNMQEKEIARKCSHVYKESFRIKPRANKKSVIQVKSADSIIVSNTKLKTSVKPEINQIIKNNGQKKESLKLITNDVKNRDKFMASDKQEVKRTSRKSSLIRGRPNTVKTGLPSGVCNRFSAKSNINASRTLSPTTSIDNDSSIIVHMENIALVSPNSDPAVQVTIDELENSMLLSKLSNVSVSDRNVIPKRKFRTKIHSYSDSKVYKIGKSTKAARTNSFPNPKSKICKADKKLRPLGNFSPGKFLSTTNALNKENTFLSSSKNEVSENNMKTPSGNAPTPETWVCGRKFLDEQSAEEEVFSKRESISMILKNNPGHVQAKVDLYDNRTRIKTISTSTSVKVTRSGASYDCSCSNSQSRVSQRKQSSSVKSSKASCRNDNTTSKNRIKNLFPPPKFIIPDSASPKPCHPLKEVTNMSGTDDVYFSHSPVKNSVNNSFKDKSPKQSIKSTLAIKPKRNSYCGHTPYKLSRVRSESSPLLLKIVDKSFEKSYESVSRSPSLVQDFRPRTNQPGSPLFKTRSSLSIEKLRSDHLMDEWNCEM